MLALLKKFNDKIGTYGIFGKKLLYVKPYLSKR